MFSLREQKKWNDSLQKVFWSRRTLGKIVKIDKEYQDLENNFVDANINSYFALYRLDQAKAQIENKKNYCKSKETKTRI